MNRSKILITFSAILMSGVAFSQEFNSPPEVKMSRGVALKSGTTGDYPTTAKDYAWNNSKWESDTQRDFTYNDEGKLIAEVVSYPDGSAEKKSFTYNSSGLETEKLVQEFHNEEWVNVSRVTTTYDEHMNSTSTVSESFSNGKWTTNKQTDFGNEYDKNVIHRQTVSELNLTTLTMKPVYRTTYAYNDQNDYTNTTREDYVNDAWKNTNRKEYFWLENHVLDHVLYDKWQNESYARYIRWDYSYGEYGTWKNTVSGWDPVTLTYKTQSRIGETFDSHQNLLSFIQEEFLNSVWVTTYGNQFLLTYAAGHLVERITQTKAPGSLDFKSGGPNWVNLRKEEFSGFLNLGTRDPLNIGLDLQCFPNPARDELKLIFSSESPGVRIEMISILGQTIRSIRPSSLFGNITWDITSLPAGSYFIRLSDESGRTLMKKIIKE